MITKTPLLTLLAGSLLFLTAGGCSASRTAVPGMSGVKPEIIPHSGWEAHPPLGHDAHATRRNLAPRDTLRFGDLTLSVVEAIAGDTTSSDSLVVALKSRGLSEAITVAEGSAMVWGEYRLAVLAIHLGEDELGRGLSELEVARASTVPDAIRLSADAGGPAERLRVRHTPTHITLHHSGSAKPLTPEEDPVEKLKNLQTWGESDRGWWDVPYHFLIDLDGNIYEGRFFEYMGETNTRYNPAGHLLISVLGNYNLQEPTDAQLSAITDLMTRAASEFGIPIDNIQGHSDLAPTACPGDHLRKYLDDGSFKAWVGGRPTNR